MLCKNDIEDDIALYIAERVPNVQMNTVLDVGANVGWWTFKFIQHFKEAKFYLFEPVTSLHDQILPLLTKHAGRHDPATRVEIFRLALGDTPGRGRTTTLPNVTTNRLVDDPASAATEEVEIETGANFCTKHGIEHINFLKIDCEGFDLKVLLGFRELLERQAIDFIEVEASLNVNNRQHVSSTSFEAILGMYGYERFRILNQASPSRRPVLWRADVVFISSRAAERYSRPLG
jgi:FkbM family methyltransferase